MVILTDSVPVRGGFVVADQVPVLPGHLVLTWSDVTGCMCLLEGAARVFYKARSSRSWSSSSQAMTDWGRAAAAPEFAPVPTTTYRLFHSALPPIYMICWVPEAFSSGCMAQVFKKFSPLPKGISKSA